MIKDMKKKGMSNKKIAEAFELMGIKADMTDKTDKAASAIPKPAERLKLGGTPFKSKVTTHVGFDREPAPKSTEVTKHTNTVKDVRDAIVKAAKIDMKDKAPGAGESPSMPKTK